MLISNGVVENLKHKPAYCVKASLIKRLFQYSRKKLVTKLGRGRDSDIKTGGKAGLRRKNRREAGFSLGANVIK